MGDGDGAGEGRAPTGGAAAEGTESDPKESAQHH